jgi:hypothetical protein
MLIFTLLVAFALAQDKILLPLPGATLTIGTDGRFSSPTLVRWVSSKPATAKVEITLRLFGSVISVGDRNKLVRASPSFNSSSVIKNVLKDGQTFSEVDISQFALTDFAGAALKDADPSVVTVLNGNASVLHVEVSCTLRESVTKCAFNDDFESRIGVAFAGGPCWFTNACDARGPPNAVLCEPSDADQMPVRCLCAPGFKMATDQNGKSTCVADGLNTQQTPAPGGAPTTPAGVGTTGEGPTTRPSAMDTTKMSSSNTLGKALSVLLFFLAL